MKFLPDTNVWIELLKQRNIRIVGRFAATSAEQIVSCSVILSELLHGAEKHVHPPERRARVRQLLQAYTSFPFDDVCAAKYAEIRHDLEVRGCVIGPFDLQIAAIAIVHGFTLVTGNMNEFSRVNGLRVEDWST